MSKTLEFEISEDNITQVKHSKQVYWGFPRKIVIVPEIINPLECEDNYLIAKREGLKRIGDNDDAELHDLLLASTNTICSQKGFYNIPIIRNLNQRIEEYIKNELLPQFLQEKVSRYLIKSEVPILVDFNVHQVYKKILGVNINPFSEMIQTYSESSLNETKEGQEAHKLMSILIQELSSH
jgi:hypothetical protein